ncbi:hypothetical protein [Sphingomonas crusticola]|uniref:hypothetical protein n=1 Tax=Sphingomonas crusticola TaxID=1697973 RepID=UPI001F07916B|nr:hypothetical protein [Sphingomonas crusticola]
MSSIPADDLIPDNDPDDLDDNDNAEQREPTQAQDVAEEALHLGADPYVESEHGGATNPAGVMPLDVPDLVDTMNQMVSSGRIDNGAFAGEPMMDDEEDYLGQTDSDDDNDG